MEGTAIAESALYLDSEAEDDVVEQTIVYCDQTDPNIPVEKRIASAYVDVPRPQADEALHKLVNQIELHPKTPLQECSQILQQEEEVGNLVDSKFGCEDSLEHGLKIKAKVRGEYCETRVELQYEAEFLVKIEELATKYAQAARKNEILEVNLNDLIEKVRILECKIDKQERQITEAESQQAEQEKVLLLPMRNIYLHQFHDQVRERISKKLSQSALSAQHQQALKSRVQEKDTSIRFGLEQFFKCDLWKFIHEAHIMAPKFFSKATLWNKFVDELLQEKETIALLGLSANSILLTRFGRGLDQKDNDNSAMTHLRKKHVFAEVVMRQNNENRPYYTELYEFLYNIHPEDSHSKTEAEDVSESVEEEQAKIQASKQKEEEKLTGAACQEAEGESSEDSD
ncbi:unnamed protein product [Sphagnum compactum]